MVSYACDRCLIFKDANARNIAQEVRYEYPGFRLVRARLTSEKVVPRRRSHRGERGEVAKGHGGLSLFVC
jgi:hypothetical protein